MVDIKDMKFPDMVYLTEFDIKVRPYLMLDEIVEIADTVLLGKDLVTQQSLLMIGVLNVVTDIPKEYLDVENEEFIGLDILIHSGLWRGVSELLEDDIENIWEYVTNEQDISKVAADFINEDLTRLLDRIVSLLEKWEKKMPRGKQWNELLENIPKNLASAIGTLKADNNLELVEKAVKMNTVYKGGDKNASDS